MENERKPDNMDSRSEFSRQVGVKAARRIKAERDKSNTVWFGLGMMGIIGWSIVIPTLLGTALGRWIDSRYPGSYSWTLMLLALGLAVGCINAWYWVGKEYREVHGESDVAKDRPRSSGQENAGSRQENSGSQEINGGSQAEVRKEDDR